MRRGVTVIAFLVLTSAVCSEASVNNPNTDWFKEAGHGVFMHFLPGDAETLAKVENFDVHALADQLESMDAKYFIFTLGQNSGFMNSPNPVYERITGYAPGERCSKRDLPLDLYRALNPKGIKLMLYLPCQAPNRDVAAQTAFGLAQGPKDQPVDVTFARKWAQVIGEWSTRYGDKVAGWWFDGGYKWIGFNDQIARIYAEAVKRGNPNAIVTFNPGVSLVRWTQAEDYTAGELTEPFKYVPTDRWVDASQWHALTYLGSRWGARDTRFSTDQWAAWMNSVMAKGGVVTLDMGPNYDPEAGFIGAFSKEQVDQMQAIAAKLERPAVSTLTLSLSSKKLETYKRCEIVVEGVPAVENPFDPDCITLDLEVTAPSDKTFNVPGFYYRPFARKLDGGREKLESQGDGSWRLRWFATEPGRHSLTARVKRHGRVVATGQTSIEVTAGQSHGLVRVEPKAKRYFRFDDGTPLFLNGLCVGWYGQRGTYDYDDWLAAYEKTGINYMRIWMWPVAFGIEWDKQDRLNYQLDNAWRLDYVLAEAQRRGVYVMVCLDYHGIFEVKPDYWGGNNYWPRHPYNAVNGGPCATQNDFFASAEAKKLYEKRLRYIVARWSAFPNVLAWEFFNEIDNEYDYIKHDDVVAWHGEMGGRLRAIDPYDHLISSSFTGGSERPDLYDLPEMEFAQYHSYNEKHPARMTAEKTARFFAKYHKPFFVSEYGTDWRGWKPDTDPHFRALHQAIWSGAFTGAAGTGMTWWWENIHTGNLYHHWSALSKFLQGTGMGRGDLQPAKFANIEGSITPYGMAARDEAFVWLLDKACDWPNGAMEADPPAVTGATVSLTGLDNGPWSVQWWSTLTGEIIAAKQTHVTNGQLRLKPPTFQADIAGHLKKH